MRLVLNLISDQTVNLKELHVKIRNRKECDQIKTILMFNDDYSYNQIENFLLISNDTVKLY
jgi:hypothetical protein